MATKIKLGQCPKNFTAPVSFKMLDGSEGVINVTYKYRTRAQFGAFLDEIYAENGIEKPADGGDQANFLERAYEAGNAKIAGQIMKAAEGWDLDVPFDEENVTALADEMIAGAKAIMRTYELAINEGRLGN